METQHVSSPNSVIFDEAAVPPRARPTLRRAPASSVAPRPAPACAGLVIILRRGRVLNDLRLPRNVSNLQQRHTGRIDWDDDGVQRQIT